MFSWTILASLPVQAPLPLLTWFDVGATTIVLVIAFALLAGMFMFIRIVTDDSDKFKNMKEMVETIFGTPAHLRPNPEQSSAIKEGKGELIHDAAAAKAPFSEPCPACDEIVTERDSVCPSCGLQLL